MKATERRVYGRIQIDYTDPFLDQSIQVSASEQANVSYPAQTADAVAEPFAKIASLDGSWILDGTYALAPSTAEEATTHQMGWWGSQLAGADGSFTAPYPTLTVTFFSRPITQLKVVGDSKRGEYPVDFDINLYDASGAILYTETVVGNTQVVWQKTLANPITQVTKMDLVVKKWSHPGRQVKILEFFTSIQEVYEGDDILLIHLLEEREVSQGSLPVGNISANEIDIRLDNSTRKFDAGNKQSPLYQLLKQNRRIKAWLGLKGEGEGTNLQQSVDFTQGTLNNLVVVDGKLQLPSVAAPTFTRNSVAYLSDGTLVNTNLPRYENGKFGQAIMVEEGTTNLCPNPLAKNDLTNIITITTGGAVMTISRVTFLPTGCPFATGVQANVTTRGDANVVFSLEGTSAISVSPNTTYTLSGWVYIQSNTISTIGIRPIEWSSTGSVIKDWGINSPLTTAGQWQRISFTFTTQSTTAFVSLRFVISGTGITYITGVQFEQKPYATSFIDGTRAAETLTIPTAGALNPQEGTVECWVYVDPNVHKVTGSGWNMTFVVSDSSISEPNQLRFGFNRTSGKWHVKTVNSDGIFWHAEYTVSSGWHYFALAWDKATTTAKMYVDGVVVASNTVAPLPSAFARVAYIGSWINGSYQLNSLIDDLRISNRARTDAEIAAAYASGQALPVDEWTTYLLRFDGNLNFGQGGYWQSPEYDLTAVGTAVGSKISWQEDADGIQRSVYAKLDNQADWVEVQNGGKLPINYGDVLTGRKLQLKAKLLKSV
ncbi:LamG domain-containing protein [Caldanaerobacter sp.]|uniref:LamG domain-containing protein n=1 Tax=Caldanaerobacter sp. TaxID=2930036 RepID=UPI003C727A46